jgi:hypothetical protein
LPELLLSDSVFPVRILFFVAAPVASFHVAVRFFVSSGFDYLFLAHAPVLLMSFPDRIAEIM